MSQNIIDADALLAASNSRLPCGIRPSSAAGQMMLTIATELSSYNNK